MLVVLGDLTAVDGDRPVEVVVLAEPSASLGEVLAVQVPKLTAHAGVDILVCPGPADLLAGHGESWIHAELVALCDALLQVVDSPASVQFTGFPSVPGREGDVRLVDAAARVTCELRGIGWRAHP